MWRPENPPQQTGASPKIPAGQREISIANRDYGTPRACVLLTVHCLYKTTYQTSFFLRVLLEEPRNPSHGDSRFNSDPHPPFQTSETLLKPLTTFYQSVGSISFIIQFRRKLYLNKKKKKWDDCSFLKLQTTNLNRSLFPYYARCACFMDNEKLDFRKPSIQSLLFKKL